MDWFQEIFGFKESLENIEKYIQIKNNKLITSTKTRTFTIGKLETPSIKELRKRIPLPNGKIKVSQIIDNIVNIHKKEPNALFQVASQFNLLEMIDSKVSPKDGITRYQYDMTQGSACAMACPFGTLYRNYFTNINTLEDIENMFDKKYWKMENGYALFEKEDLLTFNEIIDNNKEEIIENLRVGIQWDTEVAKTGELVSQIYCSALPVSYHYNIHSDVFEKFARVILEAAYEATFTAAILNKKSNKVFLTLVGGGAFGNERDWILESIEKNLKKFKNYDLDIVFVTYSGNNSYDLDALCKKYSYI